MKIISLCLDLLFPSIFCEFSILNIIGYLVPSIFSNNYPHPNYTKKATKNNNRSYGIMPLNEMMYIVQHIDI